MNALYTKESIELYEKQTEQSPKRKNSVDCRSFYRVSDDFEFVKDYRSKCESLSSTSYGDIESKAEKVVSLR